MKKLNMFIKYFFVSFCTFLCICQLRLCTAEDEVPVVQVKQGLIKGIKDKSLNGNEFYSYMSIPYAESPEGKLRFKAPVPKASWDGILDGTKMPVACLQTDFFDIITKDSKSVTIMGREDCLKLNVFTTAPNQRQKNLPVMVWIHGGGFMAGGAAYYQPYILMNRDIVLVVIQYRLGIFGFLSTEDSVIPGNNGLKDQQLALKWVKENIKDFGGNSNSITIFGESAGGASANFQILSPGSNGLFNRAILQSGTSLCPWASNKNHRKFAIEAGLEFGCSIDRGTEKYLKCMQNVNPHYLILAAEKTNIMGFNPYFVLPGVDGEFIDEAPEILLKKGKYNKVDIVQGITKDEGGLDLQYDYYYPTRRENINKNFEELGGLSLYLEKDKVDLARKVYQYYLQREDVTITKKDEPQLIQMTSDSMFRVAHDIVSNIFAADPAIKLYTYQLDHFGEKSFFNILPGLNRTDLITHADDLKYLFYGGEKLVNKDDIKVMNIILDLWTNFAKTGNPTPSGSPFTWKEATSNSFQHLSLTTSPVMKKDDFQKQRKFWSSLKTSSNMLLQSVIKDEL